MPVKKVTFEVDESLINRAQEIATAQNTTLGQAFREWLGSYVAGQDAASYRSMMGHLKHINAGRSYIRDEMNER